MLTGRNRIISLLMLLVIAQTVNTALGSPIHSAVVTVLPDGWVDLELTIELSGDESTISIKIDGKPHNLLVQGDGILLDYTLRDNLVEVDPKGSKNLTISYQTPSLTSKIGEVWNLTLNLDAQYIRVYMTKESSVLGMSKVPMGIDLVDDWIEIAFSGGPVWIVYKVGKPTLIPPPKTESKVVLTTTSQHSSSNQQSLQTQTTTVHSDRATISSQMVQQSSSGEEIGGEVNSYNKGLQWSMLYLIPLLLMIIALIALFVFSKRKPTSNHNTDEFDELEFRIIEYLRNHGGSSRQSDIIKAMSEPRATVWRRIRRMEREGKVRLRKKGRFTVVELI